MQGYAILATTVNSIYNSTTILGRTMKMPDIIGPFCTIICITYNDSWQMTTRFRLHVIIVMSRFVCTFVEGGLF